MSVDTSIFKAYDIRGIYPDQLDEDLVKKIGQAYASLIIKESNKDRVKIVVGRDMRLSSPQLRDAVVEGITSMGADVIDIGLASTPTFYFAVGHLKADGGLQVSASHNPAEYNGCKMVRAKGVPVSGDTGIMDIRDMVVENNFSQSADPGEVSHYENIVEELVASQLKEVNTEEIKDFTIVADAANAMASIDLDAMFKHLPGKLVRLNFELDGTFPSHEADPLKYENLKLTKEKVLEYNADFGIATDGDGDRYFIIMDNGERLSPEILRGILAQITLEKHPASPIGYDIRPGKITRDLILEADGKPFITRVGHSLIKEKMIEMNSPFSGESSGHFFYRTPEGSFEAPVRMMGEFMAWLSKEDRPLSEIVKPWQERYFHSGEINSVVEDKEDVFEALKEHFSDADEFSDLDGVYFEYPDYWFNVRASNTEPKMRLNLEAKNQEVMAEKLDEVLSIIRSKK